MQLAHKEIDRCDTERVRIRIQPASGETTASGRYPSSRAARWIRFRAARVIRGSLRRARETAVCDVPARTAMSRTETRISFLLEIGSVIFFCSPSAKIIRGESLNVDSFFRPADLYNNLMTVPDLARYPVTIG